jgi:4-oxalocrotonate tautomerase
MPIIRIDLLEGRTHEQKQAMVQKVTQAVCETAGAPPEAVRIIIGEMKKSEYAVAGVLVSDQTK